MSTSNNDLNNGTPPARKSGIIQGLRSLLGGKAKDDSPKPPETPKVEEQPKAEEKKTDEPTVTEPKTGSTGSGGSDTRSFARQWGRARGI